MMKVQVPLASSIVDIGLVLLSKQCLTKNLKKSMKSLFISNGESQFDWQKNQISSIFMVSLSKLNHDYPK